MRSTLDQLLGSRTRAKILRLLLTNPEKSYFVREIVRKVQEHLNSVRRELSLLAEVETEITRAQAALQYGGSSIAQEAIASANSKLATLPNKRKSDW
jgi:peptide subunit release factor 1 (eRF1)